MQPLEGELAGTEIRRMYAMPEFLKSVHRFKEKLFPPEPELSDFIRKVHLGGKDDHNRLKEEDLFKQQKAYLGTDGSNLLWLLRLGGENSESLTEELGLDEFWYYCAGVVHRSQFKVEDVCLSLKGVFLTGIPSSKPVSQAVVPTQAMNGHLETLIGIGSEKPERKTKVTQRKGKQPTPRKLDQAIGVQTQNPEWTIKKVAEEVGCSREYLSNSQEFQKWRKGMKEALKSNSDIRHGSKDSETGQIEAWQ